MAERGGSSTTSSIVGLEVPSTLRTLHKFKFFFFAASRLCVRFDVEFGDSICGAGCFAICPFSLEEKGRKRTCEIGNARITRRRFRPYISARGAFSTSQRGVLVRRNVTPTRDSSRHTQRADFAGRRFFCRQTSLRSSRSWRLRL